MNTHFKVNLENVPCVSVVSMSADFLNTHEQQQDRYNETAVIRDIPLCSNPHPDLVSLVPEAVGQVRGSSCCRPHRGRKTEVTTSSCLVEYEDRIYLKKESRSSFED